MKAKFANACLVRYTSLKGRLLKCHLYQEKNGLSEAILVLKQKIAKLNIVE